MSAPSGRTIHPAPRRPLISFEVRMETTRAVTAAAPEREITLPQHDDVQVLIAFVDDAGAPVPVTGASEITFAVTRTVRDNTDVIAKTLSGGTVKLGAPNQIYFDLTSAQTGALVVQKYHYEVRMVNSLGQKRTVLLGALSVQDTQIGD